MVSRLAFDALSALALALTALLGASSFSAAAPATQQPLLLLIAPVRHALAARHAPAGTASSPDTACCALRCAISHASTVPPHQTTAAAGAYMPAYLAARDRLAGGTGRSLTYILGNMLSAGVMVSAGFCHLLGEALRSMPKIRVRACSPSGATARLRVLLPLLLLWLSPATPAGARMLTA